MYVHMAKDLLAIAVKPGPYLTICSILIPSRHCYKGLAWLLAVVAEWQTQLSMHVLRIS